MGLARDRDVVSGIVLATLGIFILTEALQWTYLGPDGPGPGFFPVWYGGMMIALSAVLIVKAAWLPAAEARAAVDWRGASRALLTWAMLAAAVALMAPLGFAVGYFLLALGLVRLVMGKPLRVALVVALASSAGFWLLFQLALGLNLPAGSAWPLLARALGPG